MFKSVFSFIKSMFITLEDATGIVDDGVKFALLHSDTWVQEAYSENVRKTQELNIDQSEMQAKIKSLRKSQQ